MLGIINKNIFGSFLILFGILIGIVNKWRQSSKKTTSKTEKKSQQTLTHTFEESLPDAYDEIKEGQVGVFRSRSKLCFNCYCKTLFEGFFSLSIYLKSRLVL